MSRIDEGVGSPLPGRPSSRTETVGQHRSEPVPKTSEKISAQEIEAFTREWHIKPDMQIVHGPFGLDYLKWLDVFNTPGLRYIEMDFADCGGIPFDSVITDLNGNPVPLKFVPPPVTRIAAFEVAGRMVHVITTWHRAWADREHLKLNSAPATVDVFAGIPGCEPAPRETELPPVSAESPDVAEESKAARDVAPGTSWAFREHRTLSEVPAHEPRPRVLTRDPARERGRQR